MAIAATSVMPVTSACQPSPLWNGPNRIARQAPAISSSSLTPSSVCSAGQGPAGSALLSRRVVSTTAQNIGRANSCQHAAGAEYQRRAERDEITGDVRDDQSLQRQESGRIDEAAVDAEQYREGRFHCAISMPRVGFDPGLRLGIDVARVAAGGGDRRADHDADRSGLLDQSAARPEITGVVCDRYDQSPGLGCQQRAADAVLAGLAGRHACALGKDHDPFAFGEPGLALLEHAAYRGGAAATIDGDGAQQLDAPAHERYPDQLTLEHPDMGRQQQRLRHGLPARRVLDVGDVIAGRQMLAALDAIIEPAGPAQYRQDHTGPDPRELEAPAERQQQAGE